MKFWILFVLATFAAFVAQAAGDPIGPSTDVFIPRILESGAVGATFATTVIITAKWLLQQLLATKDKEIESKDKEIDRLRAEQEKLHDSQRETSLVISRFADVVRQLDATITRVDAATERRATACSKVASDMGIKA